MGNCVGAATSSNSVDKYALSVHKKIEEQIAKEANNASPIVKLLLLGPGESGKSTVLKQMRIIHLNGFSDQELLNRRSAIYSNTVQSMFQLLEGMDQLVIKMSNPDRQADAEVIRSVILHETDCLPFSDRLYYALKNLWNDINVQKAYERRNEIQLNDSAKYFFDSLDRLYEPNFMPTTQDVLMTRVPTIGVSEVRYTYKDIDFRIFDVGGQKSERRKWIHCFDNVDAILFIIAISEYDQTLREDGKTNRMLDSLQLFHDVANSAFFKEASIIVFLNKKDLFAEKIRRVNLNIAFPEFKGENDYKTTTQFIEEKFDQLNEDPHKMVYMHLTCATDTNQVQLVLCNTTDMIISENIKKTGVM
uniref:Guanine nucleotide-binding protein G(Q) subunit alpha n=1 Tax=Ascaris lumbricoides TaxID=6252 RepID=A0A0M3HW52_ASCLU